MSKHNLKLSVNLGELSRNREEKKQSLRKTEAGNGTGFYKIVSWTLLHIGCIAWLSKLVLKSYRLNESVIINNFTSR